MMRYDTQIKIKAPLSNFG